MFGIPVDLSIPITTLMTSSIDEKEFEYAS
jgi:hypothetical protein